MRMASVRAPHRDPGLLSGAERHAAPAAVAPPEEITVLFVQRAELHRHSGGLELRQYGGGPVELHQPFGTRRVAGLSGLAESDEGPPAAGLRLETGDSMREIETETRIGVGATACLTYRRDIGLTQSIETCRGLRCSRVEEKGGDQRGD
jgi:hypothetical protein